MKTVSSSALGAICLLTSAAAFSDSDSLPNDDWLSTNGNQIVDKNGNPVWLTGANWFGFNTTERVFHGLWSVNLESTLQAIADRGINILRVPISTELLWEWRNGEVTIPNVNTATNSTLVGLNTLEVFDRFLDKAKDIGLKVMIDVHSAEADNSGHLYPLWYKGEITPEIFYQAWEWVTNRYKNNDTIVAMDIQNEPHGQPWSGQLFAKWDDSQDDNNFKYACETASNRILNINPNVLVLCEGIESYPKDKVTWTSNNSADYDSNWWGGNLRGVRDDPINLGDNQAQLVYSPHDYGPLVYAQPWFYEGFNQETLYNDVWKDNWMFIHEEGISPLLIGEWGGFMDGGINERWMLALRDQIVDFKLHHTFWVINPNSGDTGGLLEDDWTTWDEAKYALVKPALWQDSNNKFVGLDHKVALGSSETGVSLDEYLGNLEPSVAITAPRNGSEVLISSNVTITYNLTQIEAVNIYVNDTLAVESDSSGAATLTAPTEPGPFTVKIVALDTENNALDIEDSVTLRAVTEIIVPPTIVLQQPTGVLTVNPGQDIPIQVNYQNAAGFKVELGEDSSIVIGGTETSITAPTAFGEYALTVSAVNDEEAVLDASDSINVSVIDPAQNPLSCTIGNVDPWTGGFVLNNIDITNNGTSPVEKGWKATLTFAESNISIVNSWNADMTLNGAVITATNKTYNQVINPGRSVSFGMQGSYTGTFSAPTCAVTVIE